MQSTDNPHFHLPYPLFDTHLHALHMRRRGFDLDSILDQCRDRGLVGAIEVAVDEKHFKERLDLTARYDFLGISAGIHPSSTVCESDSTWLERMEIVTSQARDPRVIAVGETGLDYYRDYSPREIQEEAFRFHLDLAAQLDKPIIIHNRSADEKVLTLVAESRCRRGVFHCFSSDWPTAKAALNLGFYVSFAGNITYKKTDIIRDAAKRIPNDRILIETDSPYLSPQKYRSKANHPGHIGFTLEALADLRETPAAELAMQTVANSRVLFDYPPRI